MEIEGGRRRILLFGERESRTRKSLLDEDRFEVVPASPRGDLVEAVKRGRFDLVITGPSVPEATGLDILDRIRHGGLDLPVILVSDKPKADLRAKVVRQHALLCRAGALRQIVERTVRRASVRPFLNRRGDRTDISTVTATFAKNEFGRVLETAIERGAVAITRHHTAKAVLVAVDEFNALVGARDSELKTLSEEFDGLLSKMQTSKARKGMKAAFDASPAELGKAAVIAARQRG
jgi:CheY-like chemotaxis protein